MKKTVLFIGITFLCFTAACSGNFETYQSYHADNIKSIEVYSDSWDVRFKKK